MLSYRYRTTTYTVLWLILAALVASGITTYFVLSRPDKEPPQGARLVRGLPGSAPAYILPPRWDATNGAASGSGRKSSG